MGESVIGGAQFSISKTASPMISENKGLCRTGVLDTAFCQECEVGRYIFSSPSCERLVPAIYEDVVGVTCDNGRAVILICSLEGVGRADQSGILIRRLR